MANKTQLILFHRPYNAAILEDGTGTPTETYAYRLAQNPNEVISQQLVGVTRPANTNGASGLALDLYDSIPIPITFSILDIREPEKRRTSWSKTITIPGTKNNNDFFEHFYEVNGIGFDPLTRKACVVQYRGTDIFKGYLRLNSVNMISNNIEYEVYILSEITDFSSLIADKTLRELDWSYLNHQQTYDAIVESWKADGSGTKGLFNGKLLYPLIHYGYYYQSETGTTPSFRFAINTSDKSGFDYSGSSVPANYFKVSVQAKEIIENIISETGYNIVSDFFKTEYFKSIYIDTGVNGKLGVEVASAQTNQNVFRVYGNDYPQTQKFYFSNGQVQQIRMGRIATTDGFDPSLNFNELYSAYQIPYAGLYSFEFKAKINQILANNTVSTYYGISIFKSSTPQGLSNPATRTSVAGTPDSLVALNYNSSNNVRLFFNDISLNTGDWIGIFIRFNPSGSSNKNAGLWVGGTDWLGYGARWDLYNAPFFVSNNYVDMKLQFPELSCLDFFKGIIKMFNLVVVQTEDVDTIRIEPLPWYYAEEYANKQDWTDIFDKNSLSRIEPVNFQLKKSINLQYITGEEEYLSKLWEDRNEIPYGTKKFNAVSDILTGEQNVEIPFRAVPTDVISGSTNIIIPKVFKLDLGTNREIPYSNRSHIFFWAGNRYFYGGQGATSGTTWYLTSGSTPVAQTTYPCVSHLSTLDNLDSEEISDLNFDKSFDFFGQSNDIINQFTANNLYQLWYGNYFTNLYSPETRRFSGRFRFNPLNIAQTKLTDRIFLKDSYYRIERINEADLVNWKLTDISLLKTVTEYNKIIPPGPTYTIQPNQAYPPVVSPISITGFVSTDQSIICTNTATGTTLYATSNPVVEGTKIYYDAAGTVPYVRGNFFRQTTTSQTFAVINNLGQVSEDNC